MEQEQKCLVVTNAHDELCVMSHNTSLEDVILLRQRALAGGGRLLSYPLGRIPLDEIKQTASDELCWIDINRGEDLTHERPTYMVAVIYHSWEHDEDGLTFEWWAIAHVESPEALDRMRVGAKSMEMELGWYPKDSLIGRTRLDARLIEYVYNDDQVLWTQDQWRAFVESLPTNADLPDADWD